MDFKKKTKKLAFEALIIRAKEELATPPSNYPTTPARQRLTPQAMSGRQLSHHPTDPPSRLRLAQGITLVELLIGMAILAFISLMVGAVYVAHFRLFSNQSTNIDVASQNRIALDEMVNQIREGNTISSITVSGNSCSGSSGATTIVVRLWPLDTNTGDPYDPGTSAPDSAYDYVLYCKDSGNNLQKVVRKTTSGTSKRTNLDKILATNASQLTFTYYDNSNPPVVVTPATAAQVQVQLKISQKNYDKKFDIYTDQTGKAVLRNKPN